MPANYLLPVTGGYRRPCTVVASELTPVPGGGRHCASCQHLVQDCPQATVADVAQTDLPDGQLCGWLNRPGPPARFSRRLRWFVVALVLVGGWGLGPDGAGGTGADAQTSSFQTDYAPRKAGVRG